MKSNTRIMAVILAAVMSGVLIMSGCNASPAAPQTEAAQTEVAQTEAVQAETAKTEAAQTEITQAAAQEETSVAETAATKEPETEAEEPAETEAVTEAETEAAAEAKETKAGTESAAAETEAEPEQPAEETAGKSAKDTAAEDEYGGGIFDASVIHRVEIRIDPEDWADLIKNAEDKTKYSADITIDGEEVKNVSCAPKGNSSLTFVRERFGGDRYSLKLNFGKFEKGQKFHGLKKLNLNNVFADSTYMKDFLCYNMFRRAGVDAPLCSYAWIMINGEDHGLYMVVEEPDERFLKRIGRKDGVLYKPDSGQLGAKSEEMDRVIRNGIQVADYGEGSELGYRGDSIADYPDIFENAETDAEEADELRVVAALKGMAEGKDLDNYLYTDEIIRYFAVNNFVLNFDSYTGSMLHNYYLLENDGRLAMAPWDCNMAFGVFWGVMSGSSDAEALANMGIDTPLLGSTPEQRPMWKWIADSDDYREAYHEAMDAFLADYFESGAFEEEFDALCEQLLRYVDKDPTAFSDALQYVSSTAALRTFCLARAESVRRQLDGELATESEKQAPEDRVGLPGITLEDLE